MDVESIRNALKEQVNVLRDLKKQKAPKDEIEKAVEKMNQLRLTLSEQDGTQKEKTKKEGKQEDASSKKSLEEEKEPAEKENLEAIGEGDQFVTPYDVVADDEGVDYDKLIKQFGSQPIDEALIARFEKVTGRKVHTFLRRGIFFSHRELNKILDLHEQGKPFYLYTGRGPSSDALHLGHLLPFIFTKWLQDVFGCILVVQLTDDEKFLWKGCTQEEVRRYTRENCKDIIACGFDPEKTFIFNDFSYVGHMYPVIVEIQRKITASTAKAVFGFGLDDNIGKWSFGAIQAAPSFSRAFPHIFDNHPRIPCLIPCGIDQDPYFRVTRDVAPKLGYLKPALIHSKFFPALQGAKTKMSASNTSSAVYMTDNPKQIKNKINKYAFSGGQETVEDHRRLGGNPDIDVSCQYLSFFLDDDEELEQIYTRYRSGEYLTGDVKKRLIEVLTDVVTSHQKSRSLVTEEQVDLFMKVRPLSV
eukprot:GCRY01003388.1.p1 GENE.GCRY01003388.1~~GCRY01003388.1.p1  ORF type:complete len:472 (-),score=105.21 GCRY01003388.1:24-1439(-)